MILDDPTTWNVIVTDDDVDSARIIEMTCTYNGARVRVAANGNECLALFVQERPNVIFLDFQMPGMSGPVVLKAIRELPGTEAFIAIAVTANAFAGTQEVALEAGFDAYYSKPISPMRLIENVRTLINKGTAS